MKGGMKGSIALARRLCYEIAGPTDEEDDIDGNDYSSVDVAEILSAEIMILRSELEKQKRQRRMLKGLLDRKVKQESVEPVAWMLPFRVYRTLEEAEWDWRNDPAFENTSYVPEPLYRHPPTPSVQMKEVREMVIKLMTVSEHLKLCADAANMIERLAGIKES